MKRISLSAALATVAMALLPSFAVHATALVGPLDARTSTLVPGVDPAWIAMRSEMGCDLTGTPVCYICREDPVRQLSYCIVV